MTLTIEQTGTKTGCRNRMTHQTPVSAFPNAPGNTAAMTYSPLLPSRLTVRYLSRRARVKRVEMSVMSRHLNREVRLTVLLPPGYRVNLLGRYPVTILNDGQDFG